MTNAQREYIATHGAIAIEYAHRYGFPFPSICLAQDIHESGWGKSELAKNANNYHGLKNNHGGICQNTYVMNAYEEVNGKDVLVKSEKWCKFDNLERGIEGYFKYLTVWTHYAPAFGMSTWQEALKHISKTYATRSTYYDKIAKIITDYKLYEIDPVLPKEPVYYTVKSGDSLAHIAEVYYGDYKKYKDIYKANQTLIDTKNKSAGTSKYTIYTGQKLILP